MATCSQRSWFLRVLLISCIVVTCCWSSLGNYEVDPDQLLINSYRFEFVPLSDSGHSHFKRQAPSISSPSGTRDKLDDGRLSNKFDKNSASIRSDQSSLASDENLSQSTEEAKEEFDDEVLAELANSTSDEKPIIIHDHHKYYNSTIVTEPDRIQEFWIDLDQMKEEQVLTHEMLSKSYRRAATVTLSFAFPFYGHILRNATIATGGFLYLGDYMHSWLASTQYIAPLMANFDTSLSEESLIKYADNGTHFVVQWIETALQDLKSVGTFTFQVCLRDTGDIIFAYKDLPVAIDSIPDSEHPVRVGISDAYIIDRTFLLHKRKIIYEYHRVEIRREHIANLTAVYLTALPSCITFKECSTCLTHKFDLQCTWCQQAKRCSDGMDRHRHDWLLKGCDSAILIPEDMNCPLPSTHSPYDDAMLVQHHDSGDGNYSFESETTLSPLTTPDTSPVSTNQSVISTTSFVPLSTEQVQLTELITTTTETPESHTYLYSRYSQERSSFGAAGIIGILFVVAIVLGFVSWMIYAYRNPHTPSGQIIIKYRPSQWHWLKSEADYTPASVHI